MKRPKKIIHTDNYRLQWPVNRGDQIIELRLWVSVERFSLLCSFQERKSYGWQEWANNNRNWIFWCTILLNTHYSQCQISKRLTGDSMSPLKSKMTDKERETVLLKFFNRNGYIISAALSPTWENKCSAISWKVKITQTSQPSRETRCCARVMISDLGTAFPGARGMQSETTWMRVPWQPIITHNVSAWKIKTQVQMW